MPHDHSWEDDEDGHNKPGPPLPPNPQFKAPNTDSTSGTGIKKIVGGIAGTATVGVVVYLGAKWAVAAIFAPSTGGGSLIVASAIP